MILFYINVAILVLTLVYGLMYGIKNWFWRILNIFRSVRNQQSQFGKFADGFFAISVLYFFTFGKSFINTLYVML